MIRTMAIVLETEGHTQVINITEPVAKVVRESGLVSGIVIVFCPSATSGVTTIEYEDGVVKDLQRLFDEIVAPNREYLHNVRWGDGNGHSHVRAALLGPSLTIPVVDGQLMLGLWQQIVYVDFDNRPRQRQLVAQVMGDAS